MQTPAIHLEHLKYIDGEGGRGGGLTKCSGRNNKIASYQLINASFCPTLSFVRVKQKSKIM